MKKQNQEPLKPMFDIGQRVRVSFYGYTHKTRRMIDLEGHTADIVERHHDPLMDCWVYILKGDEDKGVYPEHCLQLIL